mmetsp:Transcript_20221/g.61346  ORF Transcript_20221/g.61346 Transcript_20221/m.61346 type:complete len:174 (-) Transcript_20221:2464-2985(-)
MADANVNPITLPVPPLQIGDEIPRFTADTHTGTINSHDVFDGQYGLIVTFRRDFDPIATTEIGTLAKLKQEFTDRNCFILGVSVDTSTCLAHRHLHTCTPTEGTANTSPTHSYRVQPPPLDRGHPGAPGLHRELSSHRRRDRGGLEAPGPGAAGRGGPRQGAHARDDGAPRRL